MKLKYLFYSIFGLLISCSKEYSIEGLQKTANVYTVIEKRPFKMLQGGETPDLMIVHKGSTSYTFSSVDPGHWDHYTLNSPFVFKKSSYKIQEYNYYYGFPDASGHKEQIPVFWIDGDPEVEPTLYFVNFDTLVIKQALEKDSLFHPEQ